MWTFHITTGEIFHNGNFAGKGYSGFAECKNSVFYTDIHDRGSIPIGDWIIHPAINSQTMGAICIPLSPCPGTETFGRTGFYIHGESAAHPGQASHGCPIQGHETRLQIDNSPDKLLRVVP